MVENTTNFYEAALLEAEELVSMCLSLLDTVNTPKEYVLLRKTMAKAIGLINQVRIDQIETRLPPSEELPF